MDNMPAGSVIITPTQMYNEIQGMSKKVDHLASVIDPALTTLREDLGSVRATVGDHELRLRNLSTRLWIMTVVAAASGAGISQLIPLLAGL